MKPFYQSCASHAVSWLLYQRWIECKIYYQVLKNVRFVCTKKLLDLVRHTKFGAKFKVSLFHAWERSKLHFKVWGFQFNAQNLPLLVSKFRNFCVKESKTRLFQFDSLVIEKFDVLNRLMEWRLGECCLVELY